MISTAVIQKLISTPGINSLVAKRVFPNIIKADAVYPAVYVFSDQMRLINCFQPGTTRSGKIEIGVYAPSYTEAQAIMKAIRDTLDGFEGTVNSVAISIGRGEETTDQYDEETLSHVKTIEYEAIAESTN
ncbi:tail completion protein gp17 [Dyadobacter sandarakinus]|uniref:DUF3168 domain-containing protein n=1 Tax=Dyadobacter sandarakinus TaxID=2747268 RepID=A0ABX7I0Y5_9BACT|nr:DUF3168 domain-containing protein [Dyadobacter sandarakinus]QRQ99715.1 DUF3168 domain-containing protein [Dyadobacter sandarakinus]